MTRLRPVALLFACAAVVVAQDRELKGPKLEEQLRPGICFAQYKGCETCADLAKVVEELATKTFDERVAADVLQVGASPSHLHEIKFFPTGLSKRGTPSIDLNEVRVRLLWRTHANTRAKAGEAGHALLRVGRKTYNAPGELNASPQNQAWTGLAATLSECRDRYSGSSPHGVPLILTVEHGVPANVFRQAADVVAATYKGMRGRPRLPGVPAETKGQWEPARELEYDEKLERSGDSKPGDETVEKPIIILEEEVELSEDVPKGTDFGDGGKNLDSTSLNDAYGVGGGGAGAYGQRFGKGSLAKEGGSPGTESAVTASLRWLKGQQHNDGGFLPDAVHGVRVAATARALLAYSGAGYTHRFGTFKRTVNTAMNWLRRQQPANGCFGEPRTHLLATHALAELYLVSRDFRLKKNVEKAWAHLETVADALEDPALALCLTEALGAAEQSTTKERSALLAARLGKAFGEAADSTRWDVTAGKVLHAAPAAGEQAVKRLAELEPQDSRAWRWGTQAAFQAGGETWKRWNSAMQKHTLPAQIQGGEHDGSWPAKGERSAFDVTVDYTLALEVYYRFERTR